MSDTVHARRAHIHMPRGVADVATDAIAGFSGSWPFVLIHVVWFTVWLVLRLDINLLTLIVSLEAIFLATFVLMNQNRQAGKDRIRDDQEAREVDNLTVMNQQQLEILLLLRKLVADEGKGDEAA